MKVVIIGGSHGGIQAAITLKRLDSETEVILIEKNEELSYISSGIVLKMNQFIDDLHQAKYITVEQLNLLGITVLLKTKIVKIAEKYKHVWYQKNTSQFQSISYDKLIIATGSTQFSLNITVPEDDKVAVFKNYLSSANVLKSIKKAKKISIIGGGYIGVELCDALKEKNKELHLIESAQFLLFRYVDKEIAFLVEKKMKEAGIHLHLGESVIGFSDAVEESFDTITTNEEIRNDYAIIAVNARPDTSLVNDFLDLNNDGTIRVNEHMKTSDDNIFALGDAISYPISNSNRKLFTPLVNNVVRSATIAAMNVLGYQTSYGATQRTTTTKIFDYYVASTGLTELEAAIEGIETECIFLTLPYQLPYIKNQQAVSIKLVFEKTMHKLVGGQLLSEKDIAQSINSLSIAIAKQVTAEELLTMDFYFNPGMNQPLGVIGQAAYEFLIQQFKNQK